MAGYRIRRGNQEFPVADLEGLSRLAREGRLAGEDQVGTEEGWVSASSIPELRPHFETDPWAAWDHAEEASAEEVYREALQTSPDASELPVAAVVPLMVVESRIPELETVEPLPEVLPEAAAVPEAPPAVEPPHPEGRWVPKENRPELAVVTGGQPHLDGKDRRSTLERPRSERTVDGTEVIQFPRTIRPLPDLPRPERPKNRYASFRILTWGFVMVMVGLLGWVSMQLGRTTPMINEVPAKTPVVESPVAVLERQLRASLPHDPRPVAQAGDLSDNLTVELQQLHVDTVLVDALVTKWAGRKEDEPQSAEIRVTFHSRGALEAEMGAIGLAVGRYVHLYRLKIPVFEVTVVNGDKAAKRTFDGARACQFYEGTLKLEQYLE